MILHLHDKKITVTQNNVPDDVTSVSIVYDFELGTNHLIPVLYVAGKYYKGNYITVPLDINGNKVSLTVHLHDTYGRIVKEYTGTFMYHKMCTFGDKEHIDIYKELERLYKEIEKLKEQGEVI